MAGHRECEGELFLISIMSLNVSGYRKEIIIHSIIGVFQRERRKTQKALSSLKRPATLGRMDQTPSLPRSLISSLMLSLVWKLRGSLSWELGESILSSISKKSWSQEAKFLHPHPWSQGVRRLRKEGPHMGEYPLLSKEVLQRYKSFSTLFFKI